MGGPRRGGIGLADTKAPMVRGWDPSKSLSAEDGAGRLQMGPLGWGKRSGARPALSAAPPPPFISAPETGHPRLHYCLICIGTPPQPPGAFQSSLSSFGFGGNLELDKFLRVSFEDLSLLFKELGCHQPGPRKTPPPVPNRRN
jgi:hypothetical protein